MCEDLLDVFDNADSADDYGGGGGGAIKTNKKPSKPLSGVTSNVDQKSPPEYDSQSVTLLDDDDDDEDVPIAILSRSNTSKTKKGRKKLTKNSQSPSENTSKRLHSPAKATSHKKILKSIKQEKK